MVLNEPETSLHPDLLPALGRLIAQAAQRSQVLVVSHAARLIATLEREAGCESLVLDKQLGATGLSMPIRATCRHGSGRHADGQGGGTRSGAIVASGAGSARLAECILPVTTPIK